MTHLCTVVPTNTFSKMSLSLIITFLQLYDSSTLDFHNTWDKFKINNWQSTGSWYSVKWLYGSEFLDDTFTNWSFYTHMCKDVTVSHYKLSSALLIAVLLISIIFGWGWGGLFPFFIWVCHFETTLQQGASVPKLCPIFPTDGTDDPHFLFCLRA